MGKKKNFGYGFWSICVVSKTLYITMLILKKKMEDEYSFLNQFVKSETKVLHLFCLLISMIFWYKSPVEDRTIANSKLCFWMDFSDPIIDNMQCKYYNWRMICGNTP